LLLNKFFPIVDICLSCEDIVRQIFAIVPRWRCLATFFGSCICSEPRAEPSDLHSKFALGHTMCQSMVDIQPTAAEIRRGKEEEEDRKKLQG